MPPFLSKTPPPTLLRVHTGIPRVSLWSPPPRPDEFKELIDAVFGFDWRGDDEVVEAFSTFVSHLVSANSIYMLPTMHTLVRSLVLAPRDLDGELLFFSSAWEVFRRGCTYVISGSSR